MSEKIERELISAAWGGNYTKVRELMEKGARVNADFNGQTALQAAVRQGHEAVADYLIEHGAKVNLQDKEGKTLLMEMVERGNVDMVRLLLRSGRVDLNKVEHRYGNTALMKAVISGDVDMVRLLIRAGADGTIENKMGKSPMEWAINWGHQEMLKLLQLGQAQARNVEKTSEVNANPEQIVASSHQSKKIVHKTSDIFAITRMSKDIMEGPHKGRPSLSYLDQSSHDFFSEQEWRKILKYLESESLHFGLPERRGNSIVLGSFNLRSFGPHRSGADPRRSELAWEFISLICKRFDLLALQELKENIASLIHLKRRMGEEFNYLMSDITGLFPGDPGNADERLGFLYYQPRVRRTELASDITIDRTKIREFLDGRSTLAKGAHGTDALSKFIDFMRSPFCASFEIRDSSAMNPYHFLAVNCHLASKSQGPQRRLEFAVLMEWLITRAKSPGRMYYPNYLIMGDFNLDYNNVTNDRPRIDELIGSHVEGSEINVNFPFLDPHPVKQRLLRTNLNQDETYDHIGFISSDSRLPRQVNNSSAGLGFMDDYDYGIFNFADLISYALLDQSYSELDKKTKGIIDTKLQHEISDHFPIWIRLPMPN